MCEEGWRTRVWVYFHGREDGVGFRCTRCKDKQGNQTKLRVQPARSGAAAAAAPGRPPAGDRHPAQTGPLSTRSVGRRPGGLGGRAGRALLSRQAAAAAAALTQGLERIPEQTGYLVICDGAVLASAGDLENDERTAGAMAELVSTACAFRLPRGPELPFRRLSVVFGEHSLLATVSGQKLFVVKRLNSVPEPVVV
ncbi:ragulator complex protein LAMTOR4 [Notechis scutatus]|uniref:Ragulator complex protein LAMTOR4 n=1 Tax=Notechis scutatus TaxID=8663 RepID=A0A6J1W7A6_9SAUR|nr:ragulator complex protein LAMTOR4 [Notechis scutatus]